MNLYCRRGPGEAADIASNGFRDERIRVRQAGKWRYQDAVLLALKPELAPGEDGATIIVIAVLRPAADLTQYHQGDYVIAPSRAINTQLDHVIRQVPGRSLFQPPAGLPGPVDRNPYERHLNDYVIESGYSVYGDPAMWRRPGELLGRR